MSAPTDFPFALRLQTCADTTRLVIRVVVGTPWGDRETLSCMYPPPSRRGRPRWRRDCARVLADSLRVAAHDLERRA